MQRPLSCLASAICLALCLNFPALAAQLAPYERIFVASARADDGYGPRSRMPADPSYSVYTLEVIGDAPGSVVDRFTPVERQDWSSADQLARAAVAGAEQAFGTREVMVVVHGFNTSFPASLRRAGQIAADFDIPASTVLFSWASAGSLAGYVEDVRRAAAAEHRLEELLRALGRSSASRVTVMAHSLGGTMSMRSLANMAAEGAPEFFAKFGGVVLTAPEMRLHDFNAALARLQQVEAPVVIYSSPADIALRLLLEVSGEVPIGAASDVRLFGGNRVIAVDVSGVAANNLIGHSAVTAQPPLIALINRLQKPDLVDFARAAASGEILGAAIESHGGSIRVRLPPLPRRG